MEDSGNKGIWIRDIRIRSNLPNTQISKILKTLESKKLIKSVKSVQASKRRVYMLYDLTPDESLTGGAWYSDQDFESEFVDVLNQKCLHFLQQKVSSTVASPFSTPDMFTGLFYVHVDNMFYYRVTKHTYNMATLFLEGELPMLVLVMFVTL